VQSQGAPGKTNMALVHHSSDLAQNIFSASNSESLSEEPQK
jgi:hypothetical protein